MAPHPKKIDAKKKVDWSCKFCTKHAQKVTRAKGFLNCASDDFCRECGEHKREAHLCAYTELAAQAYDVEWPWGPGRVLGSFRGCEQQGQGQSRCEQIECQPESV